LFQGQSIRNDLVYEVAPQAYEARSITNPPIISGALLSEPAEDTPNLKDKGIFIISDGFNQALAKHVITWILESNLNPSRTFNHLTLIINSHGGELASAFAIIDVMKGSALPVHTVGLGQISSCGLLTFLAGTKGHRILTPNTAILSHQWFWGSIGKEHELLASVKQYELTARRVLDHYVASTGLTEEAIRERLLPSHDVWLSAQEALEMGICDEIKIMGA
jgi:ATP-dependent Clp endopeptidase proteolytic subunit ClpP